MFGRVAASWFPELTRVDGESERRKLWLAAYEPVLKSLVYWLIAGGTQVAAQVAVGVPLTRLWRSWGHYNWFVVWGQSIILALLACVVIVWLVRRRITRNLRVKLTRHGHPTCLRCGYNLTGNVSGRCSECGADVRELTVS
ncbi:MAG: hypothetical protein ABIG44_06965 [Planctomycetota bacterium]